MTTYLVNHKKAIFGWCTLIPALFVLVTTVSAGSISIVNIFYPMSQHPGTQLQGWIETGLMAIFIVGAIVIVGPRAAALPQDSARRHATLCHARHCRTRQGQPRASRPVSLLLIGSLLVGLVRRQALIELIHQRSFCLALALTKALAGRRRPA